MTDPFDDTNGEFLVLVNGEGQHSLWPFFIPIPEGWLAQHGPAPKEDCLQYVELHWTDMREASLIRQMEQERKDRQS
jgi:MbtH protein